MVRVRISNGRLVDPASGRDEVGDLFVADGAIVASGRAPDGFTADRVIDATGLVVAPGLVDLGVRLREPGFEYRATLESELVAAAAGGITSVACPPDTDPPLDEPGLVEMLKRRASSLALTNVYPVGALTRSLGGERLAEMMELAEAGCVAFSQADAPFADLTVLLRALQYAATFDLAVWLRPEDSALASRGVAHEGEVATRLGLPGIPSLAETVAIATILLVARETGARVHLCRISTARGVSMVREAKADGVPVTCDVSANHVHLSEMDIGFFDSNCRLSPPLRHPRDRDALVAGLVDGTIDAICSDHTPVDEDGKDLPFSEAEPGATGLELLLPLTIKWGGGRPLPEVLRPVTVGPARVLGIPAPTLDAGARADLCVFDPSLWWRVEPSALRSQGKNTPHLGYELQGRACYTLVSGQVVFER
ncbi:MAG: dihydroorotase [Betaproteobacteria bacterium]|nr:dihydroorotase [Betaproteobacteria bacterium]